MAAASTMLPVRKGITRVLSKLQYSEPPLSLDLLPLHTTPSFPEKKVTKDLKFPELKTHIT